jgi:hypothetical protein
VPLLVFIKSLSSQILGRDSLHIYGMVWRADDYPCRDWLPGFSTLDQERSR